MFKDFTSALFKKNKGFTLVELIVVSGIIIFMTAFVLINYRAGGQQLALNRSAHKLAQDIRRAQEMAMSASECPIDKCGGPPAIVPNGGYGVVFDQYVVAGETNYDIYLYGDMDGGEKYSPGEEIETIYKENEGVYIEKGVKIKEVRVDGVSPDKVSINFKPPDPIVRLRRGDGVEYDATIIILALKSNENKTKTIRVNKAGLIYVE